MDLSQPLNLYLKFLGLQAAVLTAPSTEAGHRQLEPTARALETFLSVVQAMDHNWFKFGRLLELIEQKRREGRPTPPEVTAGVKDLSDDLAGTLQSLAATVRVVQAEVAAVRQREARPPGSR